MSRLVSAKKITRECILFSLLDNQKGARKLLIDSLYREGYCLCIPDPTLIKSYLENLPLHWIQSLLLFKNSFELSIIPRLMLIFIKNKALTVDESERLFDLVQILISKTETDTIDQLFFANNFQKIAWVYYLLDQLINFTLEDFISSGKNSQRIMAMAAGIELFFDKASTLTITKLTLNAENNGFNVLHKLFNAIAYKSLHPSQISYLSSISKKIIDKTTSSGIETISFQGQWEGFSFIRGAFGTWLQLVFESEHANQFKINYYTQLINELIKKISTEKLSSILLENQGKGYILILRYLFFQQFNLIHSSTSLHFKRWCQKLFSALTIQEIRVIVDNLSSLLSKDLTLNHGDRQQLLRNFFTYLFEFCSLQPLEIVTLRKLQEQLEEYFFPSNKAIKFLKQLKTCYGFFNAQFQRFKIREEVISLDESSDLLRSECARLNVNYLTIK